MGRRKSKRRFNNNQMPNNGVGLSVPLANNGNEEHKKELREDVELDEGLDLKKESTKEFDNLSNRTTSASFDNKEACCTPVKEIPKEKKASKAAHTVTISNYSYDLTTKSSVKIMIEIPGINEHSKHNISLTATEFSFKFLIQELDEKNWSLNVPHLAHEIIPADVKYEITNKDKLVLLLPKKYSIEWMSLTPTDDSVKAEFHVYFLSFYTFIIMEGFVLDNFSKTMTDIWLSSKCIVITKNLNLFNPSEEVLKDEFIRHWFKTKPNWRTLEEVIIFAKKKVAEEPLLRNSWVLLGVAVLKQLILRCKGTDAFKFVHIPEGNEDSYSTIYFNIKITKPDNINIETKNISKSQRKISKKPEAKDLSATEEIILNFPSIDVCFQISEKLKIKGLNEKSIVERLAECLEEQAYNHFKNENFIACTETLTEVVDLFPDRSILFSNRAACYLKLGKFKESLEDGLKAVLLDPSKIDGWLCVGESNFALGTPSECIENLEKILDDTNNQRLKNLVFKLRKFSSVLADASKAFEIDDFDKAVALYQAASKVAVANRMIKLKLSDCFVLSGKFYNAISMAESLLKYRASKSDGYYIHGMNNYYQNMKAAAFENFDRCLSIDDGHEKCKELYGKARDIYFLKDRGNEYYKEKRYDRANEMYAKGLTIDSKNKIMNALINFNIGLICLQQQKVADAINSFSSAIGLNDKYIKALLNRAAIYQEVCQFKDAVKDLEAVFNISPTPNHGKLLREAKSKEKSEPLPQKSFCSLSEKEQRKFLADRKKEKANKLYKNQDYVQANEFYTEAILLDPDTPIQYLNRSACLMMLKRYKEAMSDAEKSLELDSSFVKGYLRKGKIELILGKGDDALQTFIQGLKIDTINKDLKEQRDKAKKLIRSISNGDETFEKKNFVEASIWFGDAAGIATNCSDVLVKKLESLLYLDRFSEVSSLLDKQEKDTNYYYISALMNHFNGDKEKALADIDKVLQDDPNHSKAKSLKDVMKEVYHNWEEGRRALNNSNFTKAQRFLEKAAVSDPFNKLLTARIFCDAGKCFVEQEKFQKAINHFSQAIKSKEDMILPYLERAKCYSRLGKFEEAVKDFVKVNELLPIPLHKQLLDDARLKLKKSKRKDYYKILFLKDNASLDEIKKAYKRLAKEYHPDRHVSVSDKEKGESMFKEINEAYSVLSDSIKRERYDKGEEFEDASPFDFDPFFFMFNSFFSNFPRRRSNPNYFYSNY